MANLVTFVKKLWKDATSGGTPITAAELNRMEGGISDCATQINKLGDSVSRVIDTKAGFLSGDLNDVLIEGRYSIATNTASVTNFPNGAYGFGNLIVFKSVSLVTQMYTPHGCDFIYVRVRFYNNWGTWKKIQTQAV